MSRHGIVEALHRGRKERPNERLEIDLGRILRLLDHRPSHLRPGTQHPLIQNSPDDARAVQSIIMSLIEQYAWALEEIGTTGVEKWSFYAYCLYAQACTPAQPDHADNAQQRRGTYFTMLWPVSDSAELTQFHHRPQHLSTPGPVMFDGHV